MRIKFTSTIFSILLSLPVILSAQSTDLAHDRQSNERNLYDENRARVDRQIWHDEHQFRPDYWSEDDYLYIPRNERYRYEPRPTRQSQGNVGYPSDNSAAYYRQNQNNNRAYSQGYYDASQNRAYTNPQQNTRQQFSQSQQGPR